MYFLFSQYSVEPKRLKSQSLYNDINKNRTVLTKFNLNLFYNNLFGVEFFFIFYMKKAADLPKTAKMGKRQIEVSKKQMKTTDEFFNTVYGNNPSNFSTIQHSSEQQQKENITANSVSPPDIAPSFTNHSRKTRGRSIEAPVKIRTNQFLNTKESNQLALLNKLSSRPDLQNEASDQNLSQKVSYPVSSSSATKKPPKLVIPLKQSLNLNSNQRVVSSARVAPPNLAFSMTNQIKSQISHDKLSNYDDTNFDDPQFISTLIDKLKNGPIQALSLYYTADNQVEWMPCHVISFTPPNSFQIQFTVTGQTKEVPRISLRFENESIQRFEKRRTEAKVIRDTIDTELKRDAYILSQCEHQNNPIEPSIIKNVMKRFFDEEKRNNLVPALLTEVQQQYDYAFSTIYYNSIWTSTDPESLALKKEFEENGLEPFQFNSLKPDLWIMPLQKINLVIPDYKNMLDATLLLNEIRKNPYSFSNQKFSKVVDFFTDFDFYFKTAVSNARSIVYNQLLSLSQKLIEQVTDKRDFFLNMLNLRYKHSIADLTMIALNDLVNNQLNFNIICDDQLTMDQSKDQLISDGVKFIDSIYRTFIDEPPLLIDPLNLTEKFLKIDVPKLDQAHEECIEKWKQLIQNNFDQFTKRINEINEKTKGIPRNVNEKLKDILPSDFERVLFEHSEPTIEIQQIDLKAIGSTLTAAIDDFKSYQLDYTEKLTFGMFTFDISSFCQKITSFFNNFKQYIFQYINAHSSHRLNEISNMITSLDFYCSKKAQTIEEWHEKHLSIYKISTNFEHLTNMLDDVFKLLSFLSDFLYESEESGFERLYNIKFQLHKVVKSLPKYKEQDTNEREAFIKEHEQMKIQLQKELEEFKIKLSQFNESDPTTEIEQGNERLALRKKEFNILLEKVKLYQTRDEYLEIDVTEYEIIKSINSDFDLFIPVWRISICLQTDVPKWLSTQFRELNVNDISQSLLEWETTLKKTIEMLDEKHLMQVHLSTLLTNVSSQIPHLQILRAFCNPNLRSRHWNKISELIHQQINPNEIMTWHWMLESGLEDYIIGINAISRSADEEFKVEKTIRSMIDDLRSLKLKVNEVDGIVKLEEPTYAVELLAEHQRKIQEVFIPPYVNPFISKIKDYEVLQSNIRQILKTTLDTQAKIEELKPAMDSKDLRTQHEDVCIQFDEQVSKFNDFTENFKLSLSFHQIVSNQKYVDLSKELFNEFSELKNNLNGILEEKRLLFARFMLLSDSQLVKLLSTCHCPSKSKHLFNIMYPSISYPIFDKDETECQGFVSIYNETMHFQHPVKITPEKVEKWHSDFDEEIRESMRYDTQKLISKRTLSLEKKALKYPVQIMQLVNNIVFTSNVTKCFDSYTESFAQERQDKNFEQFDVVLKAILNDIQFMSSCYTKNPCIQFSGLILNHMSHRDTLQQIIDQKVVTAQDPIWYSKVKYIAVKNPQFDVEVRIGPSTFYYGFEFGLSLSSFPQTKMNSIVNVSLMTAMASKIPAVICGSFNILKIDTLLNFTTLVGKMPLVVPCTEHIQFNKLKKMLDIAEKVDSFIVFKDLDYLNPDVFNSLSLEVLKRKENIPNTMRILGTYSIIQSIPEKLKLAYRPIYLNTSDSFDQYKALLSSLCLSKPEQIDQFSEKLTMLSNKIMPAFLPSMNIINAHSLLKKVICSIDYTKENDIGSLIYKNVMKELENRYGLYNHFDLLKKEVDIIFNSSEVFNLTSCYNSFDEKLKQFEDFLQNHYAMILLGKPLSGKTVVLNQIVNKLNIKTEYISQHSIDPCDLYGNENSGLLSSLFQETELFVFDGKLENGELETIVGGLIQPHYFTFGDNSKILIRNHKFIFETDTISKTSPALLGSCPIYFVGETFLTFEDRLNFFLEKSIEQDGRLVDPFSQTLIGSQITSKELKTAIAEFTTHFVLKIEMDPESPVTNLHCISSYFKFLKSSILNYYVSNNLDANAKNSASNLINDIPYLCLFSLFWSFAVAFNDDKLTQFDSNLQEMFELKYKEKLPDMIISLHYDYKQRKWRKWAEASSELIPIHSGKDILHTMLDISPKSLLIPLNVLTPALYLTNVLISEGLNVLISGAKTSALTDLILSTNTVSDNFTPYSFEFPLNATHKVLRQMILSILPDSSGSHRLSVRKPLLSLFSFNPNSSAAELMRFLIEHGYMHNDVSFVKDLTHGIPFIVSSKENSEMNSRLAHHLFIIRVPKATEDHLINTLSNAVSLLLGIKQNKEEIIAKNLFDVLRTARKVFRFNVVQLFTALQRIATVQCNQGPEFLLTAIAYELTAVFYDPFHSELIQEQLQKTIDNLSKEFGTNEQIKISEIAGHTLLTKVNSNVFRPVKSFDDLEDKSNLDKNDNSPKGENLTFASNVEFDVTEKVKLSDKTKQFDALCLSRILLTPRIHASINSIGLSSFPIQIAVFASQIMSAEFKEKRANESLMDVYHDFFIQSGIKKVHHILYINEINLNEDEKNLLKILVKSSNVFGLFGRGEKLQLMTEMYSSGSNPFDDDTYESMDGYNVLLSNFLSNCENYFHFCIVSSDPEIIKNTNIYKPYYDRPTALNRLINSVNIDSLQEKIDQLKQIDLFKKYPYLLDFCNMEYFVNSLNKRISNCCSRLTERKQIVDQISLTFDELEVFLNSGKEEMEKLKTELTELSSILEEHSKTTEKLSKQAQEDTERFEKKTQELKEEEITADKLRKELQKELQKAKSLLEDATKEVKALSSRDLAIIKGMNHPPHAVVLVVSAMCIVLDQPIDTSKDDDTIWNNIKKVMNDVSLLNKLISKALDSLTPDHLEQLKKIINDPNFDPKLIQRASTAAKSICTFIRSLVPYYEALENHKKRIKVAEENEQHVKQLREQLDLAISDLTKSKKNYLDMTNKLNELSARKKQVEDQLFEHSQKLDSYRKVEEIMKPYVEQNKAEQVKLESQIKENFESCFLNQVIIDLLGPFDNQQRNEIFKILKPKVTRFNYLPFDDNDLVKKWQTLNYPVSITMKENVLMLTDSRWVAVHDLKYVPDSFLKQILRKNVVTSLSVMSPNFEDSFIFAIKRNQGIVIYDFDFSCPHPLVLGVFNEQRNNGPLSYYKPDKTVEIINIPENFVVYFNLDQMIEIESPQPPVRIVDFNVNADLTTEMIALRLFNLTSVKQTNEAAEIEREIFSIKEQLVQSELTIKSLLTESSTKIFQDKNMQWEFTNLSRKSKELATKSRKLKQEHLWLFDDYPTLTLLAKNLNEFFSAYKNQQPMLWSIFETQFEEAKRLSSESLCDYVQKRIIGIFSASLPLIERVKTSANAFNLKLDGSDSIIQNDVFNRRLPISLSDDQLVMSSGSFGLGDQMDDDQEPPPESPLIRKVKSNEDLVSEFNFIESGFDKLISKLDELTEGQIKALQQVPNIIERTNPNRPILIHTNESSYQMLAFLHIFKCEMKHIEEIIVNPSVIQNAAQSGAMFVTICCNHKKLNEFLSAVSNVTSCGFLNPQFRLICFILEIPFTDLTRNSLLVSKCDLISMDSPISTQIAFSSTVKSLCSDGLFMKRPNQSTPRKIMVKFSQVQPSGPGGIKKFDPFSCKLALFDAMAVSSNHLSYMSNSPSFYLFRSALNCSPDSSNINDSDIGRFIIDFIYGADFELRGNLPYLHSLWKKLKGIEKRDQSKSLLSNNYQLPRTFSNRHIQTAIQSMPVVDDPSNFGYEPYAYDYFKENFFENGLIESPKVESIRKSIQFYPTKRPESKICEDSQDLLKFEYKLKQLVNNDDSLYFRMESPIDMSMIYMPQIIIAVLFAQDLLNGENVSNKVVSFREPQQAGSQKVLTFIGICCKGAKFDSDRNMLLKFNGFSKLPEIEFYVTEKNENLSPVKFLHHSEELMVVYMKKEDDSMEVNLFSI